MSCISGVRNLYSTWLGGGIQDVQAGETPARTNNLAQNIFAGIGNVGLAVAAYTIFGLTAAPATVATVACGALGLILVGWAGYWWNSQSQEAPMEQATPRLVPSFPEQRPAAPAVRAPQRRPAVRAPQRRVEVLAPARTATPPAVTERRPTQTERNQVRMREIAAQLGVYREVGRPAAERIEQLRGLIRDLEAQMQECQQRIGNARALDVGLTVLESYRREVESVTEEELVRVVAEKEGALAALEPATDSDLYRRIAVQSGGEARQRELRTAQSRLAAKRITGEEMQARRDATQAATLIRHREEVRLANRSQNLISLQHDLTFAQRGQASHAERIQFLEAELNRLTLESLAV